MNTVKTICSGGGCLIRDRCELYDPAANITDGYLTSPSFNKRTFKCYQYVPRLKQSAAERLKAESSAERTKDIPVKAETFRFVRRMKFFDALDKEEKAARKRQREEKADYEYRVQLIKQQEELRKQLYEMNKHDFVYCIADRTGVDRRTIGKVLAAAQEVIRERIDEGGEVMFGTLGKFTTTKVKRKQVYDFKKKEPYIIPEHISPTFKVGKTWKLKY